MCTNFVTAIASVGGKGEKMNLYKLLSWNDFFNFGMQSTPIRRQLHRKFDLVYIKGHRTTIMYHHKSSLVNTVLAFYCINLNSTCSILLLFADNFMYLYMLQSAQPLKPTAI